MPNQVGGDRAWLGGRGYTLQVQGIAFAKAGDRIGLACHWAGGETPVKARVPSVGYPQMALLRLSGTVSQTQRFLCQAV